MKLTEALTALRENETRYAARAARTEKPAHVASLDRVRERIALVEKWLISRPRPDALRLDEAQFVCEWNIDESEFARVN